MTTVASTRPRPGRVMIAIADTIDVASRNLRTMARMPQALVFALIQPVLFVLLFRYAFGGAIRVPGVRYVDYLIPGVFAQTVAFGALGTAVGLSTDLRSGLLERFRTLPMSRSAVLAGRTIADLARNLAVVAVMAGVGFAVGFRVQTGALAFPAGLGPVALFGYALSWGCVILGPRISDLAAGRKVSRGTRPAERGAGGRHGIRGLGPPSCCLQQIGSELADAAPLPPRSGQFVGHHVRGTPRVAGLPQVFGDDRGAANVDQERPAEVELRLRGRPDPERLAEAQVRTLIRVAGLGVPAGRGIRHRRHKDAPSPRACMHVRLRPASDDMLTREARPRCTRRAGA